MKLTRLKVCQEADQRLRYLKAVTGLRPNVLCRLGFCLSLNEPQIPTPDDYPQDSDRELNRYTLTGEWDDYYIALLRERCAYDGLNLDTDLEDYFRAHINRGVLLLFQRVKNLSDINRIVQENIRGVTTTKE
ncbi:MAG: DNA sulfur modification protein DndE [Chloroflexi bacterium]|nr:MAG: DNA sulfur modification protein DndE [Chloroflexota bacterium]